MRSRPSRASCSAPSGDAGRAAPGGCRVASARGSLVPARAGLLGLGFAAAGELAGRTAGIGVAAVAIGVTLLLVDDDRAELARRIPLPQWLLYLVVIAAGLWFIGLAVGERRR